MKTQNHNRRRFIKLALAGGFGIHPLLAHSFDSGLKKRNDVLSLKTQPGIKLAMGHLRPYMMTDEVFTFIKQLGVEYLEVLFPPGEDSYQDIIRIRRKIENAGLKIYSTLNLDFLYAKEVVLGLPGRDEKIKKFGNFIRDMGKAGLRITNYGFGAGAFGKEWFAETRGCKTGLLDLKEARKTEPKYERIYSAEKLWDNYSYFMKRILPVAEDMEVRLALHPNDPPVTLGGVENIFINKKSFENAMEISNHSPYSGLLFCVGTWAEMMGAEGKGEDVLGAIRFFGKTGNIFHVHFRNVSSPLPRYYETFLDNGYLDMFEVMKTFKEVGYTGAMEPDHVPEFKYEKKAGYYGESGYAYSIGYMRGLLNSI